MMNLRGVLEYIKKDKRLILCIILVILGFTLLIIGSFGDSKESGVAVRSEQDKIRELCASVDGVGECYVTLNYEGESVVSIVVLCEGGDSPSVKKRLSDMLVTLYGIGYNRIMIDRLS